MHVHVETHAWARTHTLTNTTQHTHQHTHTNVCSSKNHMPVEASAVKTPALLKACLPLGLPTSQNGSYKSTQCRKEKVFAPSWPNYRGHPGPGVASPDFPYSPAHLLSCVPGISDQAVSRTQCPLGLNYLAGPWPLKWLRRPPGGYFSLTCHHLFSRASGLQPGHF